jgi:hypothetical protein
MVTPIEESIRKFKRLEKEFVEEVEHPLEEIVSRVKALEEDIASLPEKLSRADIEVKEALSGLALGKISRDELGKRKKNVLEIQEILNDAREIKVALDREMTILLKRRDEPIKGSVAKLTDAKHEMWRAIFKKHSEQFTTAGSLMIECYTAYRLGGGHRLIKGGTFLNEIFGENDPDTEMESEAHRRLSKLYGIVD